MKKLMAVILVLCMLFSSCAMADMLLPNLDTVFGVELPSLRHSALMDPITEESTEDGGKRFTFEGITKEIYSNFSSYLSECGCTLTEYSVNDSTITMTLAKEDVTFTFEYNVETLGAVVIYPKNTYEEKIDLAKPTSQEALKACELGDYITFGSYPQGENGEVAPIEWLVLKVQDGKALLLSKYGLDAHRFDKYTYQGWDKSEIRGWLNDDFLNKAFTASEQASIVTTTVKTGNNAEWVAFAKKKNWSYDSVNGGVDTQDKIFLLSLEETMDYGGYRTLEDFYYNGTDKLKAVPTKYAVKQGVYQSDSTKLNGEGCCWWWLRSPGYRSNGAAGVYDVGRLSSYCVFFADVAVRPAFWLNLSSLAIN